MKQFWPDFQICLSYLPSDFLLLFYTLFSHYIIPILTKIASNTERTWYIVRFYNTSPTQLLKPKEYDMMYYYILHSLWIPLFSIFNFHHSSHALFNSQLQGLCEWRDIVARAEDESTGYILPNKSVLEIGKWNFCIICLNVSV